MGRVTCRGPAFPDGYRSLDKTDRPFAHNVEPIDDQLGLDVRSFEHAQGRSICQVHTIRVPQPTSVGEPDSWRT